MIKDKIKNTIKQNPQITFFDLLKKYPTLSKSELGEIIKDFEDNGFLIQMGKEYILLDDKPSKEGFVQWNLTGNCWLSIKDKSNHFGLSFSKDNADISIYNKKKAFLGKKVLCKIIEYNQKEYAIVVEYLSVKKINFIAVKVDSQTWNILNNNFIFKIHKKSGHEINDICIFDSDFKIIDILGNIKDSQIETQVVKLLTNIKNSPELITKIKPNINDEKIVNLDLPFYTIDSIHTKDIDDAIYIIKEKNIYKLYVAIADVSSYIGKNHFLDIHSKENCTSFYFPMSVIHMLPPELATKKCSLNPSEDKLAMVCEVDIDYKGEILDYKFYQAKIKSQARLTYNDVELILDNQNPEESLIVEDNQLIKYSDINQSETILKSLQDLEEFSILKKKESFNVARQTEFEYNEKGKIQKIEIAPEQLRSQKMVEAAMLTANILAAQFLYEKYPQFGIFRNQFKPMENEQIKPAFYDFNNEGHYGLRTDFYTHFTSPIRRYCDLLVHRLIKSILSGSGELYDLSELNMMAEKINKQQTKSKQISNRLRDWLVSEYIERLVKENNFDKKLKVVDFLNNGVIARNKQNIDFFIPLFKLNSSFSREIENMDINQLTTEEKTTFVEYFNKIYRIYVNLEDFNWTDSRNKIQYKSILYKN